MGCGPAGGLPAFDPWGYSPPVIYQQPRPAPRPVVVAPPAPVVRPVRVPPPAALGVTLDPPPVLVPSPNELGIDLPE